MSALVEAEMMQVERMFPCGRALETFCHTFFPSYAHTKQRDGAKWGVPASGWRSASGNTASLCSGPAPGELGEQATMGHVDVSPAEVIERYE